MKIAWILLGMLLPWLLAAQSRDFVWGTSRIRWHIKESEKPVAPGPNYWSGDGKSVFVDSRHFLHLKILPDGDRWQCAEVASDRMFGYGVYTFYISSNFARYPANIMAGLFLYENDHSEIDVEFTRWGKSKSDTVIAYTLHSKTRPNKQATLSRKFPVQLNSDRPYTTHQIFWYPDSIRFLSYYGHYPRLPSKKLLISETVFTRRDGPLPAGKPKKIVVNFYWHRGQSPEIDPDQEYEFVVNNVMYQRWPATSGTPAGDDH